jgi:hypothetical protein
MKKHFRGGLALVTFFLAGLAGCATESPSPADDGEEVSQAQEALGCADTYCYQQCVKGCKYLDCVEACWNRCCER